jgi:hypothetical protein
VIVPRWRLGIVAGALIVLTALGGGLVQAASGTPTTGGSTAAAAPGPGAGSTTTGSDRPLFAGERLRALRDRLADGRLGRFRKHLVHGTFTVLDRDGAPVTVQLDHGTVSSIGEGSITIAEAGGSSVTVGTTAETRVRKGGKPATLAALAVGDEVVVDSVVDGGSATARRILVPRPATAPTGSTGS